MKMVTVVARETFPYAGITRYAGASFDATTEDAKTLLLIGRVDRPRTARAAEIEPSIHDDTPDVPAEAPTVRRQSRRKDIVPEP